MGDQRSADRFPLTEMALVLLASAAVFFSGLERGSLADWDEAVYAQVSREMLQSGGLIDLRYGGKPWVDKPPLFFYLASGAYRLFGVSTFSSRLWPALFGIGTVAVTFLLSREMFGRSAAFMSSLILVTSPMFVHYGRMMMLDVPVTFFIVCAFYSYVRILRTGRGHILLGACIGLGVLTKHVVGLIPLLVLIPHLISLRGRERPGIRRFWVSLLVFLVLVAPWYLYQYFLYGSRFVDFYFGHNFSRQITSALEGHDYGNAYYLRVLWSGLGGWAPVTALSVVLVLYRSLRGRGWHTLVLSACAVPLIVFFVAQTKLPWYLIPVFPALAVSTACLLERFKAGGMRLGWAVFLFFFVLSFAVPPPFHCNDALYRLDLATPDQARVHESVKKSPAKVFYLGFDRYASKGLFAIEAPYVSTTEAYPSLSKYPPLYSHGGYVLFVKDPASAAPLNMSVFPPTGPSSECYAYMPGNLGWHSSLDGSPLGRYFSGLYRRISPT